MNNDWRELPTMADVAAAQAAGDEIEVYMCGWEAWFGTSWSTNYRYRARSVPKVEKVQILGWILPVDGITETRSEQFSEHLLSLGWIRYPKLDDEIEVPK